MVSIESVKSFLLAVWSYGGVKVIVLGVVLNLALALAVAVRTHTFSFRVVGDFLFTQLLPYIIVYAAFSVASEGTGFEWVASTVLALITVMIGSAILANLQLLGVPIPASLTTIISRPTTTVEITGNQPVITPPVAK